MLAVPTIKVELKPIFHAGVFSARIIKKRIQNVKIKINPYSASTEMFLTIPHESKHAEQSYNLHKFCNFNVVPKDDLSKAILISNILKAYSESYTKNLEYHSQIDELDAFVFQINQINKLMNKYPLYNNFDFNLFVRDVIFSLLYRLRYNFEGVKNPEIKKSITNLRRGIKDALSGQYGMECQNTVAQILKSGFSVENAYESITSQLDKYCSWIIEENHKFNKLGATRINLATNGQLNYAPKDVYISFENVIDGESIDPYSEYGAFIKKYACANGEYKQLIENFKTESQR